MTDHAPADDTLMAPDSVSTHADGPDVLSPLPEATRDAAREVADGAPAGEGTLAWSLTADPNPFHRRLVFTDGDLPVLDLSLDPLTVQDLLVALGHVHTAQRAALGLGAAAGLAAAVGVADTEVADTEVADAEVADAEVVVATLGTVPGASRDLSDAAAEDGDDGAPVSVAADDEDTVAPAASSPLTWAWWRQHKLLAFLLLFAAISAGIGALTGSP